MSVSPSNSSCSPQTQRDSSRQTARTGSEVKVVFPLCMTQTTGVHCSILCRGLMDTGEDCCFVTMCLQALISDRGKDKQLGSANDCLFALPEDLFSFFHHLPLTPPPLLPQLRPPPSCVQPTISPDKTMCGRHDVKIQMLTNSFSNRYRYKKKRKKEKKKEKKKKIKITSFMYSLVESPLCLIFNKHWFGL